MLVEPIINRSRPTHWREHCMPLHRLSHRKEFPMTRPENGLRPDAPATAKPTAAEDANVDVLVIGDLNPPPLLAGASEEEMRSLSPSEGTGVTGNVIPPPAETPQPPAAAP